MKYLSHNIKFYPYYYAACSFLAFMPVFFLYFSSILSLREVLLLESLYYISVVILEIPTGYFSDLVGRKKTLIAGSVSLCLACILYLAGSNLIMLALGQVSFAFHMSFISGTNTVFHFESLDEAGLKEEYGDREAIVNKYGMIAGGLAALIGGAISSFGLSWAYIITLIAALLSLFIAIGFREPKHFVNHNVDTNFIKQLVNTLSYLKNRSLAWIFGFFMVMFILAHVPYEFYQPYIDLLSDQQSLMGISATMMSGIVFSASMFIAAFSANYSMRWARMMGTYLYLIICSFLMLFIVFMMGTILHFGILFIILLRSFPWAAIKAPIYALITPNIESGQRATFHSFLSLMSRLSFFITLSALSFVIDSDELTTWDNLSILLQICAGVGLILTLLFIILKPSTSLDG